MSTTYRLDEDTIHEADEAETIQILAKGEIHKVNTTSIAKVIAFDVTSGRAEVEICAQRYVVTNPDHPDAKRGGRVWMTITLIAMLTAAPGGAGQSITTPLEVGDFVVVNFSRESLDAWVSQGNHGEIPRSAELWNMLHAVIIARVQPFGKPFNWEEGAIVIGDDPYKGGPVAVDDPLMRVRVKRGEMAELCREQTGQDKRYVRVDSAGKIAIGDDANELLGIVDGLMSTLASGSPIVDTATGSLLGPVKVAIDALRAQLASIKV